MKNISLLFAFLFTAIPTLRASVDALIVGSMAVYEQTATACYTPTVVEGDGPCIMFATVQESGTPVLSGVSLKYPSGATLSGVLDSNLWMCHRNYSSAAEMVSDAREGRYVLSATKKSGGTVNLNFDYTYSMAATTLSAPYVIDFIERLVVDANRLSVFPNELEISVPTIPTASSAGQMIVKINGTDGSNYMDFSFDVFRGSNASGLIDIPAALRATRGKKFMMDLQFVAAINPVQSTKFSGAVESLTASTITRVPLYTPIYIDKMASFISTRTERDWIINTSDGEVVSEQTTAPFVRVDLLADLPTSYVANAGKVTLRLKTPGTNPITATSVVAKSSGVTRCQFSNLTPGTGSGFAFVFYDADGSGCVYENPNFLPLSLPSRNMYLSTKLTLANGIVQRVAAQYRTKDSGEGSSLFPTNMDLVLHFRDGSPDFKTSSWTYENYQFTYDLTLKGMKVDLRKLESIEFQTLDDDSPDDCIRTDILRINSNDLAGGERENNWAYPDGATKDSFLGWFNDSFYPFVYSASADVLKNGSYKGDGAGWLYFSHAPNGDPGYYIYRYATSSWAYTRGDWHGWVYDYAKGWIDLTP